MAEFFEVLLEAFIDSLKLLPILLLVYLLLEYIERNTEGKLQKRLKASGKLGPVLGALLGCVPQCGFSVAAADLYAGRVITMGTLMAVFISTSDEALPIIFANTASIKAVLLLLAIKVVLAMAAGYLIDLFYRKKRTPSDTHEHDEHCECGHHHDHAHDLQSCGCHAHHGGIIKSALIRCSKIYLFLLAATVILNVAIFFIGEDRLSTVLMTGSIFQPFLAGLIGLIPNCAASVILAEMFIAGKISFGAVVAGLSTGAGIGLLMLFKSNKHIKENIVILALLYGIGVGAGMLIDWIVRLVV